MEITSFLGIGIVGIVISLGIEFTKKKWGIDTFASRSVLVVASLVAGFGYYYFSQTPYWTTVVGILTTASTFYAFFLAKKPSQG